ncbi:hypothetical protein GIB67_038315 [Kingdonia uniflora]|uniref:Pentatricopeptide repeat-containing protein n=1 Tax=Kingdonia uniflora TaxID=39325 RepID=A0A7J7KUM1_9MAGN|nr:hypothetical protein GIB67_038315 [Kingdonia uniflora]
MNQIFHLINGCKTVSQLQQIHSQNIIYGHPSLLLTKLLYKLTLLFANPNTIINYALQVFNQIPNPSSFTYNNIIRAHTLLLSSQALLLFVQMRRVGVPPDSHTFPFALKACPHLAPLGRTLHCQAIKFGFGDDIFVNNTLLHFYSNLNCLNEVQQLFENSCDVVSYNVLIHGFIKAGQMTRARNVFDKMPFKNVVSWSTLLSGYAQTNKCDQAIQLFKQMVALGVKPDNVGLVSTLSACAQLGALEEGKTIHSYMGTNGIPLDEFLLTGLVDMYAKCGCIDIARDIFESNSGVKNLFTWNAMVVGLAMHGHGELSLEYFSRMRKVGVKPDGVSFLGALVGCSHAGLVNKARQLFQDMENAYGVQRELKHYGCMVDLLGRAGFIEEALEMIERTQMKGDVFVWGGLLGGCKTHGNVKVAEIAAEKMIELDPEDGGVYKIMANIYANASRWEDVTKMRRLMNVRGVNKNAGCSSIQVDGKTHEFIAGDKLHPQVDEIYCVLDGLTNNNWEYNNYADLVFRVIQKKNGCHGVLFANPKMKVDWV